MSSKIVYITITPEKLSENLKTELNIKNEENSVNDIENILQKYFEEKEENEIEEYINECGGINNTMRGCAPARRSLIYYFFVIL